MALQLFQTSTQSHFRVKCGMETNPSIQHDEVLVVAVVEVDVVGIAVVHVACSIVVIVPGDHIALAAIAALVLLVPLGDC